MKKITLLKDTKWMDIVIIDNEQYQVSALRKGEDKIGVFAKKSKLVFFDKNTEVDVIEKDGDHNKLEK